MDYLDPKKKKQKKYHLMFMYGLLGVAISIATIVVVYLVNGYTVDSQTGEVVRNSLLYVDTKPESAEIFVNGQKQRGRTDARLALPEGNYNIEMIRDGYRKWNRDLVLEGGSLRRLTYARLIPEKLDSELGVSLPSQPTTISQSIDKRWLIMAFSENPLLMQVVDLERPQLQAINLQLPIDILTTKLAGKWDFIDWADDNKTVLAKYVTAESVEYLLINREDGTRAKNLQKLFSPIQFNYVELRSRKNDEVYLFNEPTGGLWRGSVGNGQLESVQTGIIKFKSYDNDVFLYIAEIDSAEGRVSVFLKQGSNIIKLRELKKSDKYLLDISKLGNSYVMGVGSTAENRIFVYNDPIKALKNNDFSSLPVPTTALKVERPEEMIISADSSTIAVRGGSAFATHEFEADRSYSFVYDGLIDKDSKVRWLDGQHMTFSSSNKQILVDFDGSNRQELVISPYALGSLVNRDFDKLYTFSEPEVVGGPYRMMQTYLRSAADR
jgi:hypothetical protein